MSAGPPGALKERLAAEAEALFRRMEEALGHAAATRVWRSTAARRRARPAGTGEWDYENLAALIASAGRAAQAVFGYSDAQMFRFLAVNFMSSGVDVPDGIRALGRAVHPGPAGKSNRALVPGGDLRARMRALRLAAKLAPPDFGEGQPVSLQTRPPGKRARPPRA